VVIDVVTPDEIHSMSVDELLSLRDQIEQALSSRREHLEQQLRLIGGSPVQKNAVQNKVLPRYRSRKDPKLQWSGRGALPRWMREEMKGTKLTKEDFQIASR
jgi:DNA-binding protein H-NS